MLVCPALVTSQAILRNSQNFRSQGRGDAPGELFLGLGFLVGFRLYAIGMLRAASVFLQGREI